MRLSRLLYRLRQFKSALGETPSPDLLEAAHRVLNPTQIQLFLRLQPSEQAHSLRILHALLEQGEQAPELLQAALLHDVGKSCQPLRIWERVAVVLVRAFCPGCVKSWGRAGLQGPQYTRGWRRPFAVAEGHPTWGAELARQAGLSDLAVELIRRHQEKLPLNSNLSETYPVQLLRKLQAVDDEN